MPRTLAKRRRTGKAVSEFAGRLVRETYGLRQPESRAAAQDELDRGRQVGQMARRDEDRIGPGARPHGGADHVAAVDQRRPGALFGAEITVTARQQGLAAADAGPLQPQAHMAGDADPARMRDAHAVEDEHVRFEPELGESLFEHRPLAEAQQARNIRKGRRALRTDRFERPELRKGQDDDRRLRAVLLDADVNARDETESREVDRAVGHDLAAQLPLQRDRFARRNVPVVTVSDVHRMAQVWTTAKPRPRIAQRARVAR